MSEETIEDVKAELEKSKTDLENAKAKIEELETALEDLKVNHEDVTAQLAEAKKAPAPAASGSGVPVQKHNALMTIAENMGKRLRILGHLAELNDFERFKKG